VHEKAEHRVYQPNQRGKRDDSGIIKWFIHLQCLNLLHGYLEPILCDKNLERWLYCDRRALFAADRDPIGSASRSYGTSVIVLTSSF
jgi:hypothetical protein